MNIPQEDRLTLEAIGRASSAAQGAVRRARIVLLAADGHSNAAIARLVGVTEDTVRRWRGRWADEPKTMSLHDRHRSGRPPSVTVATRAPLVASPVNVQKMGPVGLY
ncbi:MAG: helix-turn-helix domain-containing protein [Deltaproteobacteria bacterium]|nr:helix-turn-helix domain-containing protein [Deltaproteobacteria bacterium]